jgi:integrase
VAHEIRPRHAEHHKSTSLKLARSNIVIRMDLITLSQVMNYAVACGCIKESLLSPVRGLPATDRSEIWLRLKDIVRLLYALPRKMRGLAYFLILTGARLGEALEVRVSDIDWGNGVIWILNSKRRRRSPAKARKKRALKIDDLGPRFVWLLTRIIKPDPQSGYLFPGKIEGTHLHRGTAEDWFSEGVKRAGLKHLIPDHVIASRGHDHLVPHDCRGSFLNHAAIAGWSPQKLRAYAGQTHMQSIESYLGEAESHDPAESIFRHPPLKVRRCQRPQALVEDPDQHLAQPLVVAYDRPSQYAH